MGFTVTELTKGTDVTDGTSYQTASIAPSANKLIVLCVACRGATSGSGYVQSVSGNGLTWKIVKTKTIGTRNSSMFRSMGSAPSSGVITMTMNAQALDANWGVYEIGGVKTSGANGDDAVGVSGEAGLSVADGGTLAATLGAFASSLNMTFAEFQTEDNGSWAMEAGYITALDNQISSDTNLSIYHKSSEDGAPTATLSTASSARKSSTVAMEVIAAAAAGAPFLPYYDKRPDVLLRM